MSQTELAFDPDAVMEGQSALLLKQTEAFEQELLTAQAIQRFMLPPETQTTAAYEITQLYQPLYHIGGDFCDTLLRPDGTLVALIGDITGHGVPAAMTFAMLKLAFAHAAKTAGGPAELLTLIQRDMAGRLPMGAFVTAQAAIFAPDGRSVRLASAGHPEPLLLRAGRATEVPQGPGFPLLVVCEANYDEESSVALEPDDRLILLTDGTLEARGADGRCNSAAALTRAVETHAALTGVRFLQTLYESLFFGQLVFHDDVTLLAIRSLPRA